LGGLPKLLAPISGRPFLEYLLAWLAEQGVRRLTLCLGHRAGAVVEWIKQAERLPLSPAMVVEPEPLGTAGAVAFALPTLTSRPVLVMNGDTFVGVGLQQVLAAHLASGVGVSLVCVEVKNGSRYGTVQIAADGFIERFLEKNPGLSGSAWINAGIYLFEQPVLDRIARLAVGSLERDLFEQLPPGTIYAVKAHGAFIDIGTPESLAGAAAVFGSWRPLEGKPPQ
jgi:mannose-1-phosphate guanylyltransferase